MKQISFLLLTSLFLWSNCKPNTKSAPVSDTTSTNDSRDTLINVIETDITDRGLTYPKVWFTTIVENALLRDTPSIKSASSWGVPKGTILFWTGIETSFKESIPIRGKSQPLPWLQVDLQNESPNNPWIYEGCVAPHVIDCGSSLDSATILIKRWLILEEADSTTFIKVRKKAKADTLRHFSIPDPTIPKRDSTPIKIMVKGREKIIRDYMGDGEGFEDYTLLDKENGWYIIDANYWEWVDYWFIKATDGKEFHSLGSGGSIPLSSPSNHFWVFPSAQSYGDIFNTGGLEIFDSYAIRSFGLQLPDNNYGSGDVADIVWQTDEVLYFKTSDNNYFKVELKAIFE